MKRNKLSVIFATVLCFALTASLTSCNEIGEKGAINAYADETVCDRDENYIDSFVFFGESTTYHLKSRGVLRGGVETMQVWGTESGTVNLDMTIDTLKIVYPETKEKLTVTEASARKKPERILLCFGLNGAVGNVKKGKEYFKSCYIRLLNAIKSGSPDTEIYLATAYPVARSMDMSRYTVSAKELNSKIEIINSWTRELAIEYGVSFLDTASVVKNGNGFLHEEYHTGDGHHLTTEAYFKILEYIKTH